MAKKGESLAIFDVKLNDVIFRHVAEYATCRDVNLQYLWAADVKPDSQVMLCASLKMKWGKKSGRYELRQDVFVLSVFVGETPLVQCTLTSESTAHDCLDYLREKIDLNQAEFFGLRFAMRLSDPDRRQMRWVDVDRPLRKQLEKWACKPRQIQLAILYHTPNVFALHDQTARSLYFMLLKLDVLAERFASLDADHYVRLAAYGMQVEQSDYDPSVHVVDYLREMNLLPERFQRQAVAYDELLARVVAVYETLTGMQSAYAAFCYIVEVQQCEGYGEEHFPAKDDESIDIQLGYSLEAIFVRRYDGSNIKYRWFDIRSITSLKRNLILKCQEGVTAVFTMEDVDMARYVVDVLTWQWTYATTDAIQQSAAPMSMENLQCGFRRIGQPIGGLAFTGGGQSRHSNVDVNSTRTTNSVDMSAARLVNRSSSLLETNRIAAASSLINVSQPVSSTATVHAVSNTVHPSILNGISLADPNGAQFQTMASSSTPSLAVNRVSQRSRGPKASGSANVLPVYRPLSTSDEAPRCEGVEVRASDEKWLRAERRAVLKKMLAQRQKAVGSSPEIHMFGVTSTAAARLPARPSRSNPVVRRANNLQHARPPTPTSAVRQMSDETAPTDSTINGYALNAYDDDGDSGCGVDDSQATPPAACPKWCSTPNLLVRTATVEAPVLYIPALPIKTDLCVVTDPTAVYAANITEEERLLARVKRPMTGPQFSRGHVVASSAAGATVGHPIVYPIPAPAPYSDFGVPDMFLPPTYHNNYLCGPFLAGDASMSTSNTSSTAKSFVSSSVSSAAVKNLSATPSDASIASTSSRGDGGSGIEPSYNEEPIPPTTATAMAMRQRIYRQQNAAAATTRPVGGCPGYRTSTADLTVDHNNRSINKDNKFDSNSNNNNNNTANYNFICIDQQQQQNEHHARHSSNNSSGAEWHALKSAGRTPAIGCSQTTLKNMMLAKLAIPQAVETEFAGVPAKRLSAGHSTSQCPDNQARNRVGSVFPYEDTRVVLRSHRRNLDGYVNASHIDMTIGEPNVGRRLRYIVAQAPMRNTVDDFWAMVWETGARLIVMLANPHQLQKATACPAYWPMKAGEKLAFGRSDGPAYRVRLLSSSSSNCQTTSVLALKGTRQNGPAGRRTVYHLYCADFSEDGVPLSMDAFLGFIDAVNSIRKHIENEEQEAQAQILRRHCGTAPRSLTAAAASKKASADATTVAPSPLADGKNSSRSQSIGRMNLLDVANRLRAHSVESGNLLRKKFSVNSSHQAFLFSNGSIPANLSAVADGAADDGAANGEAPPTLVHCMDGASESGVFVLVEVILRCIENNINVEVAQLLRTLRQQRMCLVRTPAQYRFVYELVLASLGRSRLI